MLREAFRDVVIEDRLLDQLGPALNSGRSIFLYGDAGTGKTYIAHRLARALRGRVLIPHALLVEDTVVQVFDPVLHRTAAFPARSGGLMLEQGHDPRFECCDRPVVVSGGELTADMLEVTYYVATRIYTAPLQMKANNGLFLIDDLGRQRIAPAQLFNRWIVPMEEKKDYLSIGAGRHFCVPFRVVLAFSTNFDPLVLADDAFLRRIGYKIELRPITPEQYARIWRSVCRDRGVEFDPTLVNFVVNELHAKRSVPLLPCHPRDLLGMAIDQVAYFGSAVAIDEETLTRAWDSYFVRIDNRAPGLPGLIDIGEQTWPGNADRC